MRTPAALFLLAFVSYAADVTGAWAGSTRVSLNGKVEEDTVYLALNQVGNIITGTAGPSIQQQSPIKNGTIEGNHVVLEVPVPHGVFRFDINLVGDHLKGNVIADAQGQTIRAEMDATRVK